MCNPLVSRFIARLEQPETSNGLARGLGLGSASNGTLPFLVGLKTGGCQISDICAADSVLSDDHDLLLVAPCGIGRPCATSLGRSYRRWSVGRVGGTVGCLTAVLSTRELPFLSGSPCWLVGFVGLGLGVVHCSTLEAETRSRRRAANPGRPSQPQPSQAAQPRETCECLLKHQEGNRTECSNWGLPPGPGPGPTKTVKNEC